MCFCVILCHCWTARVPGYLLPLYMVKDYAVPVFMFISFYFQQKTFVSRDKVRITRRIEKLVLPQIIWALIYFAVFSWIDLITKSESKLKITSLFWQILTGHSPYLNPTMWFQIDLIIISILFFIIFNFSGEYRGVIIIICLSVLSFFLQYSGINYRCFGDMRYEVFCTLGRIAETFPAAAFGFISSKYSFLELEKRNRGIYIFIMHMLSGLILILAYYRVLVPAESFGYAGIWKVLFAYSITCLAFNFEYKDMFKNEGKVISFITSYTLGIYCIHRLVARILSVFLGVSEGKLYQCIIIYCASFMICWMLSKLPFKWIKNII